MKHILKVECVNDMLIETRERAPYAIVEYIGYDDTGRRHSSLLTSYRQNSSGAGAPGPRPKSKASRL